MAQIRIAGLKVDISLGTAKFEQGTRKARKQTTQLQKTLKALDQAASQTAKRLGQISGAGLVAAGAFALKSANDFDKAFSTIRRGTGATGESLKNLQDDFKATLAQSSDSIGDVGTAIADLNTRTGLIGKPLQSLTSQVLDLSRITGTNLAGNVETITRVFGDWGIANEDAAEATDYLFKVSQTTGIGLDKLGKTIVQYGAPLRQFGFSFEEAAALIGKFNKEGVNTEIIFSGLRQALPKLAKAGVDLQTGFQEISEAIKNAGTAAEANAISMKVFGAEAGADMAAAIREGRFEIDELSKSLEESDETIRKAAEESQTLGDAFTKLRNQGALLAQAAVEGTFLDIKNAIIQASVALSSFIKEMNNDLTLAADVAQARWGAIFNPFESRDEAAARVVAKYAQEQELNDIGKRIAAEDKLLELRQKSTKLLADSVLTGLSDSAKKEFEQIKSEIKNLPQDLAKGELSEAILGDFETLKKNVDLVQKMTGEVENAGEAAGNAGEAGKPFPEWLDRIGGGGKSGSKGAADKAAEALKNLNDELEEFKRSAALESIQTGIDNALERGDFGSIDVLKEQLREATQLGVLAGLDESVRNSEAAKELIGLYGEQAVQEVNNDVADSLKQAHESAVETWQSFFENAITGVKFDLEDMFKQVAVGFAAEIAASILPLGDSITSPQGLGGSLAKELLGGALGQTGGSGGILEALGLEGGLGSIIGSFGLSGTAAHAAGIQGPVMASGAFSSGTGALGAAGPYGLAAAAAIAAGAYFKDDLKKVFGLGSSTDLGTQIRKGIQEGLTDALNNATQGQGIQLNNPLTGGSYLLDVFNFRDASNQFDEGGFDFLQSLSTEAQGTFDSLALAFTKVFDLPEGTPVEQVSVLLAESLMGSVDNARLLVQQLGLDFETLKGTMLETAESGEISWLEYNSVVRDLGEAFEPGLSAIGATGEAFDNLVGSGARGIGAVKSLKDLAVETLQAGGSSLGDLEAKLLKDGKSFEEVQKIMQALAGRGVQSLDELANASNELAGSIVGDLEAAGFGFEKLNEDIQTVKQAMQQLEDFQFSSKRIDIEVNVHGDDVPESLPTTVGTTEGEVRSGLRALNIPALASGGLVTAPTLAFIGEQNPEMVVPYDRWRELATGRFGGRGGSGMTVVVNAPGSELGAEDRIRSMIESMGERAVYEAVRAVERRMGSGGIYG